VAKEKSFCFFLGLSQGDLHISDSSLGWVFVVVGVAVCVTIVVATCSTDGSSVGVGSAVGSCDGAGVH